MFKLSRKVFAQPPCALCLCTEKNILITKQIEKITPKSFLTFYIWVSNQFKVAQLYLRKVLC